MELKPLAQLLEDMLYEATDEGLEVCLAETPTEAPGGVSALHAEYALRYARAVQSITEHRGARFYTGSRGDIGFPEWLKLDSASCWSDAAGVIYVGLSTSLSGMRLVGGGKPHPVRREAITMMPGAE
ncbi:MAG: hypothetical protein JWN48_3139 [Myxococcaceae bacterium]|nr:hypothetical protein [Myxococcaceae bacterium]